MGRSGRGDDEDDAEDDEQAGAAERMLGQEVGGDGQIGGRDQYQQGSERRVFAQLSLKGNRDGGGGGYKHHWDCDQLWRQCACGEGEEHQCAQGEVKRDEDGTDPAGTGRALHVSGLANDRDGTGDVHDQQDKGDGDEVDTAAEDERCQEEDSGHNRVNGAEHGGRCITR